MNKLHYFLLSFIAAACGVIYFAISHEWIIFRNPFFDTKALNSVQHIIAKKTVTLHYWQHQQFKQEKQELLWTEHAGENITHLINSLLTLVHDEKILKKRISLQSTVLTPSQTIAYLSFDKYPLNANQSTFEKWMFFESILKTIRSNNILVQEIQFLVDHQPLVDHHLDFSNPWPINGFMR